MAEDASAYRLPLLRIDPSRVSELGIIPSQVDPYWQVRTLKFFVDGIVGARTAALSEPVRGSRHP